MTPAEQIRAALLEFSADAIARGRHAEGIFGRREAALAALDALEADYTELRQMLDSAIENGAANVDRLHADRVWLTRDEAELLRLVVGSHTGQDWTATKKARALLDERIGETLE